MGITRDDAPRRPTVNSDVMAPATAAMFQAVISVSCWIGEPGNQTNTAFQQNPTERCRKSKRLQILLLCVQNEEWDGRHFPTCHEIVPWLQHVATPKCFISTSIGDQLPSWPSLKFKANQHQPLSWGVNPSVLLLDTAFTVENSPQVCMVISCHVNNCTSSSQSAYPTYPIAEKDRRSSLPGICSWSRPQMSCEKHLLLGESFTGTGPPKSDPNKKKQPQASQVLSGAQFLSTNRPMNPMRVFVHRLFSARCHLRSCRLATKSRLTARRGRKQGRRWKRSPNLRDGKVHGEKDDLPLGLAYFQKKTYGTGMDICWIILVGMTI